MYLFMMSREPGLPECYSSPVSMPVVWKRSFGGLELMLRFLLAQSFCRLLFFR